jgi:hypothetical protein
MWRKKLKNQENSIKSLEKKINKQPKIFGKKCLNPLKKKN